MSSRERIIKANPVELCVETFGYASDPTILLVHGASAAMVWWEEELCERIAALGRHVIRFDKRDTGRSVSYPHPIYTGLIAMALGTAINHSSPLGFIALVALCGALWWKAREEERVMSTHFPAAYAPVQGARARDHPVPPVSQMLTRKPDLPPGTPQNNRSGGVNDSSAPEAETAPNQAVVGRRSAQK